MLLLIFGTAGTSPTPVTFSGIARMSAAFTMRSRGAFTMRLTAG